MSIRSELNAITHRLLDTAPTDYGTLHAVCHELHDFWVQTTRIDPHDPDNRKNRVHSDMGTEITVYQDVVLNFNQSGLTMPFPLRQFLGKIPAQMRFEYNVDRVPGLRVTALPD